MDAFLEKTKSLCPVCKQLLDAEIAPEEGKVFMRKRCNEHGEFKVLLSSDAVIWEEAKKYNKPGQPAKKFQTEVDKGCPFDCGLCPDHKQHACLGIVEIIQKCNMECPTCFSSSSPLISEGTLSLEEAEKAMDALIEAEGRLEILQLSGGEPTIHPQILEMVRLAKTKNIKNIMINTNGKRLANDPQFVKQLAAINSSDYPIIYLQFDGFREETYQRIRGEKDLLKIKIRALDNLKKEGISVMLVCTVQKGVNDSELGDIVRFVMENEHINGVVFQPTFFAGRYNQQDRLTIPDLTRGIEEQTSQLFKQTDFFTIPCCYPGCSTVTYAYVNGKELKVLPREIDVSYYLDYFSNTAFPDIKKITREALEGLYSAGAVPNSNSLLKNFCISCNLPLTIPELKNKVKMILIQPFMDAWNFDVRRAEKCCIMEALPDGRIIPFCVYNSLYRGNGYAKKF